MITIQNISVHHQEHFPDKERLQQKENHFPKTLCTLI